MWNIPSNCFCLLGSRALKQRTVWSGSPGPCKCISLCWSFSYGASSFDGAVMESRLYGTGNFWEAIGLSFFGMSVIVHCPKAFLMLSNWTDEFALHLREGISLFGRPVLEEFAFSIAKPFFLMGELLNSYSAPHHCHQNNLSFKSSPYRRINVEKNLNRCFS